MFRLYRAVYASRRSSTVAPYETRDRFCETFCEGYRRGSCLLFSLFCVAGIGEYLGLGGTR
jgi:hypothetical protein